MKIGNLIVENPIILAPMAGVTDYPFRQISREMNCQLIYTEMVSSKGLIYGNRKTRDLMDFDRGKKGLIGIQIFGGDPETMARAAVQIKNHYRPDLIDINMGCPTPKIVKNGSGAALMKVPERAKRVMEAVASAVDIPVTVKIRMGWDHSHVNAVDIAKIAEEVGLKAVAIHGRTREDFYRGEANWDIIREVKREVTIPVIGNGDVFTPEDAKKMMEETGCDGVMVARGVRGNPWLLKRAYYLVKKGEHLPGPTWEERINMAIKHLDMAVAYYGEKVAIPRMRKHIGWYLKGLPGNSDIKDRVNKMNCYQGVKEVLIKYRTELGQKEKNNTFIP
ncbi:tRNA dihydrouridine synthase DusB [Halothermothrix orenii]|uniref:tRNA-dihydrouridine synthase n=1 Tax=Halothermothrix orenii (strain H 168 / OCM 544 / DSM 9562) TaxID=373903 RepID=B8D076_HALOH|nr:tRNA dihydrouridine synthase DusB [Halothermothrix orenii]ACL68830.1 putative TIM-barrel protein, nifR3 family [Halothermothrix orenii H 168]